MLGRAGNCGTWLGLHVGDASGLGWKVMEGGDEGGVEVRLGVGGGGGGRGRLGVGEWRWGVGME